MVKILSSLFLTRRAYSVTAENVRVGLMAPAIRKAATVEAEGNTVAKEAFWMRDPNTGNWIPENHFGEVDVAELRSKLLSKKTTSSSPSN
ncbi:protein SENESCENCE-ASSOCIATED GENE 21, mitochondrial-like [Salvia miltiorrhiza]|uniref:protein SENESCENCE-ASSOCIATED GENE 21, mitochondrial-like n=1 Tax=Salvia miltiorrhiza TaxID=226208 RepID=UPI0025AC089F|nr:protein SENESCENCE-ASSOCIATED GENE 21, mitochondrial-like [Salvia miltiorrhiza]